MEMKVGRHIAKYKTASRKRHITKYVAKGWFMIFPLLALWQEIGKALVKYC